MREATVTEIKKMRAAFRVTDSNEAEGHLSEKQWESLACEELDPGNHEVALDHILGCGRCTEIHKSLLVLREHAHEFDPGAPVPKITRKPLHRSWVFAGVLAVAATLVFVIIQPLGPGPAIPGTSSPPGLILRSSQLEPPAVPLSPIGPVPASGVVFSWEPSQIAQVSIVQLIDESGEVVWTSQETENTSIEWPGDVAEQPGHYYWRVLSVGGATKGEQASGLVAFEITESPP